MAHRLGSAFLRTQSDDRLVALASAGHRGAFDVLVARHERGLRAVARRIAGPDAEHDITQQALLKAWMAVDAGTEVQHASGWLHRIVRSVAVDHRRIARDSTELDDAMPSRTDLPSEMQRRSDVREALDLIAALPEEQRVAFVAAVQGQSQAQIADELGLSEGAVRQIVFRTRAGLRAAMTAVTPYPLVVWAAQRMTSETAMAATGVLTGGGAASAALLTKAGTAVLATSALVGGVVVAEPGPLRAERRAAAPAVAEAQAVSQPSQSARKIAFSLADAPGAVAFAKALDDDSGGVDGAGLDLVGGGPGAPPAVEQSGRPGGVQGGGPPVDRGGAGPGAGPAPQRRDQPRRPTDPSANRPARGDGSRSPKPGDTQPERKPPRRGPGDVPAQPRQPIPPPGAGAGSGPSGPSPGPVQPPAGSTGGGGAGAGSPPPSGAPTPPPSPSRPPRP